MVAPNWIGDALMAQPLLMRLLDRKPGARIDLLAPPRVAAVLRRMPEVSKVIEADLRHGELQLGDRWRLGRMLRGREYTEAYVLPNTMKSALAPSLARIPLRVGYLGESRVGLLNRIHRSAQPREPMSLHYARLAEEPGTEPAMPLPAPCIRTGLTDVVARFGIAGPYLVLCPGAEYGPAKRWPYFRELASRLRMQIVLLGAAGDPEDYREIPGLNLIGKTSLDDAIDLIAKSAAVVSNDSGLMHVAAAAGRPVVALFGSSSPEHTGPQTPGAKVFWLQLECSPCYKPECPLGHFRCMRELAVEPVLQAVHAALGTAP